MSDGQSSSLSPTDGGGDDDVASPAESLQEMEARHKKELKTLDGAKRAALKKTKGTAGKGKKGKEAIAAVEEEYAAKERELKDKHSQELQELSSGAAAASSTKPDANGTEPSIATDAAPIATTDDSAAQREKKQSKARRKKERAREKVKQRENQIAEELANAGPSRRDLETAAMKKLYLDKDNLTLKEVAADGHCLYRAVAAQCDDGDLSDYSRIRMLCADTLASSEEDYAPFAEFEDSYAAYVQRVRSSAEWGGQLELRALAHALRRPVVVYSADSPPVTMGEEASSGADPILLSFHKHYYALGEHYNYVVPKDHGR